MISVFSKLSAFDLDYPDKNNNFIAAPSPFTYNFPFNLHFSQLTQSMIREIL